MTNPNDSAFPSDERQAVRELGRGSYVTVSIGGLTKREYFAAMAMQGAIAGSQGLDITSEQFATLSVKLADALIKELSK